MRIMFFTEEGAAAAISACVQLYSATVPHCKRENVFCPTCPTVFTKHRPSLGCFVIGRSFLFPYRHFHRCELARYKHILLETEPTGAVQFKIHYETKSVIF